MSKQKAANSQLISKIFTSRKIILDLAKERGYNTDEYDDFTINEILILYNNQQLDMLLEKPDGFEKIKKIYYKYHLGPKLRAPHVCDYIEDLYQIDVDEDGENLLSKEDDLIIVCKDEPNDALKNSLNMEYDQNGYFANIYNLHNYLYNILENNLVPKHEVINENRKEEIAKEYNIINESQWPEISRYDPVALAIGLRPGEVCEITRNSPTALETKYYRRCK
jgi:DNA-directed RNA polymerase subunit H